MILRKCLVKNKKMGLRWCWYNTMPAEVHFLVIHTGLSFEKIVQKEISFQWFSKMYTIDNSSFALAVGWSSMLIDYRVCEEKSKKPNTLSASENHWKSNCWEQEKKLEIFEIKNLCLLSPNQMYYFQLFDDPLLYYLRRSLKAGFSEIRVRTWVQVVFRQKNRPLIGWPNWSTN